MNELVASGGAEPAVVAELAASLCGHYSGDMSAVRYRDPVVGGPAAAAFAAVGAVTHWLPDAAADYAPDFPLEAAPACDADALAAYVLGGTAQPEALGYAWPGSAASTSAASDDAAARSGYAKIEEALAAAREGQRSTWSGL